MTFYLQATAALPSIQNGAEVENLLLDRMRAKVKAMGYEHVSSLIDERVRAVGPPWLKEAPMLRTVPNYLRSGLTFVYVQVSLTERAGEGNQRGYA